MPLPPAAKAAILIAALVATLTAFLLVELLASDSMDSLLTFALFVITVIVSLSAVFGDHRSGGDR